jgi:hypothetical protein
VSNSLITYREAKGNFFDRKVVQDALGRETAGAMAKIGGFVRTAARRSIKPARRLRISEMPDDMQALYKAEPDRQRPFVSSKPGESPRGRTKRLKASILFAFDKNSRSVVAGPTQFPGSRADHAPSVLEFGGDSTIEILKLKERKTSGRKATEQQIAGLKKASAAGKLKAKRTQTLIVPVKIEPRPYMRPALDIVRPRIEPQFRNLIRG